MRMRSAGTWRSRVAAAGCAVLCGLIAGCDGSAFPPPEAIERGLFGAGFLWGSAIAGFQADMGCPTLDRSACDDPHSDWFAFTTDPATTGSGGAHLSGQDPGVVGPGFWELYDEDVDRAHRDMGHNALRFSIEWSRIFPTATDDADDHAALLEIADAGALTRYRQILASLSSRGMTPIVTLNHYSLPLWLHDPVTCHTDFAGCTKRGWVDKERAVREAAKYAGFVARELGGEVDWWATLNEPLQNMLFGYINPGPERSHPPALLLRAQAARTVLDALIEAHARMYDAIKAEDRADADGDGQQSQVGIVYPLVPFDPADPDDPEDLAAVENVSYLWNEAFLRAVALGDYDANLDGQTTRREDLAGRMDWVGVNWYFSIRIDGAPTSFLPDFSPLLTFKITGFEIAENRPERLAAWLGFVNDELGVPALISENGEPDPADDGTAARYLVRNVSALQDAVQGGADVRGYMYWTLTDNYEWNHGMDVRMGLYAVDKDDPTKARAPRQAVDVYAAITAAGQVTDALRATWLGDEASAP